MDEGCEGGGGEGGVDGEGKGGERGGCEGRGSDRHRQRQNCIFAFNTSDHLMCLQEQIMEEEKNEEGIEREKELGECN